MNEISKDLLIKDGIRNIDKICNILDYMAVRCTSHNISFNIYVNEIIESINMEIADLLKILTTLINNSINACLVQENPYINIHFTKTENYLAISIANPIITINHKKEGLGLKIVKDIIDSYKNLQLKTEININTYNQKIYIFYGD